jgi:hypothetical protein
MNLMSTNLCASSSVKRFSQPTLLSISDPGPVHSTSANVTLDLKQKKKTKKTNHFARTHGVHGAAQQWHAR